MAFLRFENVSFAYDGMTQPLFTGVNAHFAPGWTGIVGANGAGKSTLLKLAIGELQPQRGHIWRLATAVYAPQRTDDPPAGGAAFMAATDNTAGEWRRRLGVGDDWLERWSTLSHGERKRAQIAVALWLEPEVLALDEPTNHIDAAARGLLLSALRRYRGVGLLVSHDRELLDALCAQCAFIEPPEVAIRPGGVSAGAAQARIEEAASRERDDEMRHAAQRLRQAAQRRREEGQQTAVR
ncbi:MAG: ATP-binding cassette domain-containing protein, partial [Kiritimatiellae bacterium]|nr:ATP-binding cassette domain-containing protein [Kiritimatiellia bacterium]